MVHKVITNYLTYFKECTIIKITVTNGISISLAIEIPKMTKK